MKPPAEPLDPTASPAPVPGRLWNRNFFLLWQGQTLSQLGNQAYSLAMMFWLMKATGSATLMGTMMFASLLPGVLLGPFGGTVADRWSRIGIAVVCDLISGLSVLALGFVMLNPHVVRLDPGADHTVILLMFGVSVTAGILRAFFTPALSAAIPDLVTRDQIPAANAWNQFSIQGSTLVGQAVGGMFYNLFGPALLFLGDGVSFLYAAVCALFIRTPPRPARPPVVGHPFLAFLRETADGFRYLWRQTGIRDFTIIASVVNFFSMPILVLLPFYVELYLRQDARWYGFLLAGVGAGSVVGFILSGALKLEGRSRERGILLAMLMVPVSFVFLGFVRIPFLALALMFVGGIALGVVNVYLMSMIQLATPDEVRGRVMGVITTLSAGLTPLGMVVGGVVGDLTGKNVPVIYAVCCSCTFLISAVITLRRSFRDFLANG